MNILVKLRETTLSVVPIVVIVFLMGFFVVPLPGKMLLDFFVGAVLLIIGLTLFLHGVDVGIMPFGEQCGNKLTQKQNLTLLLIASFFIGFLVTVAEPDIQVLSNQVKGIYPSVNRQLIIVMIALGIGIFMTLGLLKIVLNIPLHLILLFSYLLIFVLAFFEQNGFTSIAFDSGGATTGPMTVPFIMALGLGVSRSFQSSGNDDSSFGLTGISSAGPVLAMILFSLFFVGNGTAVCSDVSSVECETGNFLSILPEITSEALMSLGPLLFMFIVFQIFLLKMSVIKFARVAVGFLYAFLGLVIFLCGVNGAFMETGRTLGILIGEKSAGMGGIWSVILVVSGIIFGAIVVCAEPAVWALTNQVEEVSGGTIRRKMLLVFLASGVSVSVGIALLKTIFGFSLMAVLVPGYSLAIILSFLCPKLFVGIAFDSGGVASGPISSTFVLSFAVGASNVSSNGSDPFGVLALIAMFPLIAIQILGLIYGNKRKAI